MPKPKNYINNKDLTACVVEYQKNCRKAVKAGLAQPSMPNYIGQCINQICWRLTKGMGFDFGGYTYHDEMVMDAIERCVYAVMKFNNKKSSCGAFSYLTTVAINAKKKRIKDEKKQNYIKHKHFQSTFIFSPFEKPKAEDMKLSDKVISDFEDRAAAKKLALTKLPKTAKIVKRKRK